MYCKIMFFKCKVSDKRSPLSRDRESYNLNYLFVQEHVLDPLCRTYKSQTHCLQMMTKSE